MISEICYISYILVRGFFFLLFVKKGTHYSLLTTGIRKVEGDYINIMKTTFYFNFDLYQALNSMDIQRDGNRKKLSIENLLFKF